MRVDTVVRTANAEHRRSARFSPAAFGWLLLALIQLPFMLFGQDRRVNVYDEGFPLYYAVRILRGDVPYADFWAIYTPGQHYTLAVLFRLFGERLMVERMWDGLVRWGIVLLLTLLARRVVAWPFALAVSVVSALMLVGAQSSYGYPMYPALLFAFGSVWALLVYFEKPRRRWLVLCGASMGIAALYRHDVGLYAAITVAVVLLVYRVTERSPIAVKQDFIGRLRALAIVAVSAVLLVLPFVVYFLFNVPAQTLWENFALYPFTILNHFRSLPLPTLLPDFAPHNPTEAFNDILAWLRFYLPLAVYGVAVAVEILDMRRVGLRADALRQAAQLLLLLGLGLFYHGLVRAEELHLLPTALPALLLAVILVARLWRTAPKPVGLLAIVLLLVVAGNPFVLTPLTRWRSTVGLTLPVVDTQPMKSSSAYIPLSCIERGGCYRTISGQREAIAYIQEHTTPDERIFVGVSHHDQITVNDVYFYFGANRQAATKYAEMLPGIVTTLPIQAEIIYNLDEYRVRYVIIWTGSVTHAREPNQSARSSKVTILDDYIAANFTQVEHFDEYLILMRK